MNSFIYEGSAFEERVGKTSFQSENLVTSSIGNNARRGKNISYSSLQRTRSQKLVGVYKRNFGVSQVLPWFWWRRVSKQNVHAGRTGSTEEWCIKGVNQ